MSTPMVASNKPRTGKPVGRGSTAGNVSDSTIESLAEVFQMLGDKSRLKILLTLALEGELNVSALCRTVGQSQPAVSHHLYLLRMNKLVRSRRDGKHNYYSLESRLLCQLLDQFFADYGNGHKQIQFDDCAVCFKTR